MYWRTDSNFNSLHYKNYSKRKSILAVLSHGRYATYWQYNGCLLRLTEPFTRGNIKINWYRLVEATLSTLNYGKHHSGKIISLLIVCFSGLFSDFSQAAGVLSTPGALSLTFCVNIYFLKAFVRSNLHWEGQNPISDLTKVREQNERPKFNILFCEPEAWFLEKTKN